MAKTVIDGCEAVLSGESDRLEAYKTRFHESSSRTASSGGDGSGGKLSTVGSAPPTGSVQDLELVATLQVYPVEIYKLEDTKDYVEMKKGFVKRLVPLKELLGAVKDRTGAFKDRKEAKTANPLGSKRCPVAPVPPVLQLTISDARKPPKVSITEFIALSDFTCPMVLTAVESQFPGVQTCIGDFDKRWNTSSIKDGVTTLKRSSDTDLAKEVVEIISSGAKKSFLKDDVLTKKLVIGSCYNPQDTSVLLFEHPQDEQRLVALMRPSFYAVPAQWETTIWEQDFTGSIRINFAGERTVALVKFSQWLEYIRKKPGASKDAPRPPPPSSSTTPAVVSLADIKSTVTMAEARAQFRNLSSDDAAAFESAGYKLSIMTVNGGEAVFVPAGCLFCEMSGSTNVLGLKLSVIHADALSDLQSVLNSLGLVEREQNLKLDGVKAVTTVPTHLRFAVRVAAGFYQWHQALCVCRVCVGAPQEPVVEDCWCVGWW